MSKQEQNALMAYINSFRPSKRVTAFEQLADGKILMEVLNAIDSTHFKSLSPKGVNGPAVGSSDNWVLKMNALKRLHRLILSFPISSPHHPLSTSSLQEPPFATIIRDPASLEGSTGLLQIVRMVLALSVWAPGNEKVISKIQSLGEGHMAELMRSIEEVMATMPPEMESSSPLLDKSPSPHKKPSPVSSRPFTPVNGSKSHRREEDDLVSQNQELLKRVESMSEQIAELSINFEEAKSERDDALEKLTKTRETSRGSPLPCSSLRTSQTGTTSEIDRLRKDLTRAEEELTRTEADLEKQTTMVKDLMKAMEDLKAKASETAKLKDQLDEYRHTAEKLRKTENVVEKYKKKLEESAGLRREMRTLEEDNSNLLQKAADLESELKKSELSRSKPSGEYRKQIEELQEKCEAQNNEIADLTTHLEECEALLTETRNAHVNDKLELQAHQERLRELELGSTALRRNTSLIGQDGNSRNLDEELQGVDAEEEKSIKESKIDLKLRIKALEREVAELSVSNITSKNPTGTRMSPLQVSFQRNRKGILGDNASLSSFDTQATVEDVLRERDALLLEKQRMQTARDEVEKQLQLAREDLSLLDLDQKDMLSTLRKRAQNDTQRMEEEISSLKDQVSTLLTKDRAHLEEIKMLLVQKVDLQTAGIASREKAIEREMVLGVLRANVSKAGLDQEVQRQILSMVGRNEELVAEVRDMGDKLEKAKTLLQSRDGPRTPGAKNTFDQTSPSPHDITKYETQISKLKEDLMNSRANAAAIEKRYKLEQQLMLSSWQDLGSKVVKEHLGNATNNVYKRSQPKVAPQGWLSRQRRYQEEAGLSR